MIIGITGGIGSGKSSLARLLVQRGAVLVDADRIGHQVLDEPAVSAALVQVFGREIIDGRGQVVRKELGRLAFAGQEAFGALTRIVQPALEPRLWQAVAAAEGPEKGRVVVVDAALIFEWGVQDRFDFIAVVDAPETLRRQRAAARQGLSEAEVEKRMAWQLPTAEKAARAHLVVSNAGTLGELEEAAARLWERIGRLAAEQGAGP